MDCTESGQVGALLRLEGLYSSQMITRWRKQRDEGILTAMTPKKRGRKNTVKNPMTNEVAMLQKGNEKLRKKLWEAEKLFEVFKAKKARVVAIQTKFDSGHSYDE